MSPFWGFRPYPRSRCPHHGVPCPLWECLSPCRESIPSLGILSGQSQLSAFPQSPAHTSSACGADSPIPARLPIDTRWVCPPRGSLSPLGTAGLAAGSPCGCSAPSLAKCPSRSIPRVAVPRTGLLPLCFPHWDAPSGLSLSSGGLGVMLPPDPPPLTPAEMKDGPGAPGIPQPPPSVPGGDELPH